MDREIYGPYGLDGHYGHYGLDGLYGRDGLFNKEQSVVGLEGIYVLLEVFYLLVCEVLCVSVEVVFVVFCYYICDR